MTKFYFAEDGNYGDADGLIIIDTDGLDDHFEDQIEWIGEYDLSDWAEWFVDNNHPMPEDATDGECYYCENYEVGSLADIDAKYADGEGE